MAYVQTMQDIMNPVSQGPNTPAGVKSSRDWAAYLLRDSQKPVDHWAQGVGNIVKALQGGYTEFQAAEQERKGQSGANAALLAALGVNAPTVTPQQAPSASPQFAPPPSGQFSDIPGITESQVATNQPRGMRNLNPGNIEDGAFAKSLPGYVGSDGRFAKFASLDDGNAAMDRLLQSYGQRGFNTPQSIINRWAPPTDNNPTNTYAANVAKALGVDPTAPLDMNNPAIRKQIMEAITLQENGAPRPSMNAPVPSANPMSPQGFSPLATTSAAPASAGVAQSSPAATPTVNRAALAQILNDPWAPDSVKAAVLQQLLPKDPKYHTLKEGERLLATDPRTNRVQDLTPAGNTGPNFDKTGTLRKEIADVPEYKRYSTVVPLVKDMTRAAQTPGTAGDVSMLYAFAKIMDPESVVREGEYNTLTKLQSLPEQIRGNIDKYLNGQASLGPRIRQELLEAAYNRGDELRASAQQRLGAYNPIIQDNKINPQHVMPHFFEYPERSTLPKLYDRTQQPAVEAPVPDARGVTTIKTKNGPVTIRPIQ